MQMRYRWIYHRVLVILPSWVAGHHARLLSPEERFEERKRLSKPLIDEFYAWLGSLREPPKSLMGKAIYYAESQRKYLERYLLDGRLEISNNRAERTIRPFVMGRKNWLFSNTPNGAHARQSTIA